MAYRILTDENMLAAKLLPALGEYRREYRAGDG